ncbi:hypothetical protein V501_07041 [Pseudogymnoascus sp. VKM F-4519 (FW-2642)]|nr:hypothetical protein V501_07041 [Pseudogymnoascus sp. VKM F-4519 (FW-2642)]
MVSNDSTPASNALPRTHGAHSKVSVVNDDLSHLINDANHATHAEKAMTTYQAFKTYPKAIMFSMILSTAIVMESYDVLLLANLYASPGFAKHYGSPTDDPKHPYQIPAPWQAGLSNGAAAGQIIGLLINGVVSERFGYRKTMIVSLVIMTAFIFIPFFAENLIVLAVGEILCGIPWGVFQTLTTAYASEVCPTQLRAYLTTYNNLCWVFGQLIGSGVLRAHALGTDKWSYKIPFAIQWIWPVPILIGVLFAPESPWWLVRRGSIENARQALRKLTSFKDWNGSVDVNIDQTLAMMVITNETEKALESGVSYLDCFKGSDLRRTEIVCATWSIQSLCGSTFMGYSTYFYIQAGLPTVNAFDMSMAQYALGAIGTVGSWFLMSYVGRRTIYIYGLSILTVLLLLIGLASFSNSTATPWAIGSLLLAYTFIYDTTVGPICYSLVSEMPSTRLKTKSIVLARCAYNIFGIVNGVITPYMLNPTAWNWKGKSGFFWAGLCFFCSVWSYFRLPEPKGRTYGELDDLFARGISARNFKGTAVTLWQSDVKEKGVVVPVGANV